MDQSSVTPPAVQVHPTRRCNLRCLHCYSVSSPDERDLLPPDLLAEALTDAFAQGYRVASFSGGEPVLYPALAHLLKHAKELGMRTTVTSNGMLLKRTRLDTLAGCTDVLAISLDGVPESHNRMRASNQAFERMQKNLEGVRKSGIDFGFIFTLTQHNVDELAWAAQFAVEEGAKLFQIHPLEEVGRAADMLGGSRPDEVELAFAFLEAERIRHAYGRRLFVQVDIFHRDLVRRYPERFYADEQSDPPALLADCVAPLVVESDGAVVPLGCGFSRRYGLGSLFELRLRDLAPRWIARGYSEFRQLCRIAYAEACAPSELPFLNWYELVGSRGWESPPVRIAQGGGATASLIP
jgi:MoaA/NifB/PqqE/SkfB family radical SAM enzyme